MRQTSALSALFVIAMVLDRYRHPFLHWVELLASYELEDFADLRPDKIDSFALGAVIFELLTCNKLQDLSTDQTLAQFIYDAGTESAMALGHVMLPWLPPADLGSSPNYVGYTHELKNLVMRFLEPNSNERLLPYQVQESLRNDPLSPLLLPHVCAAQTAKPGDPITIDNIQLGMVSCEFRPILKVCKALTLRRCLPPLF